MSKDSIDSGIPDVKELWENVRKDLVAECGDDKNKLAVAELLGLRKLAASALSRRIMCEMTATNSSKRKFTR